MRPGLLQRASERTHHRRGGDGEADEVGGLLWGGLGGEAIEAGESEGTADEVDGGDEPTEFGVGFEEVVEDDAMDEEGGGGKARLAEAGVFEGIDIAMMTHPGQANLAGEDTLGRIKAKLEFFGRTAHAASAPEVGLNALDALIAAYTNISLLRQQMTDDARIHGIITHGGDAPNVIPDYTAAIFYVRAATLPVLEKLFGRFRDCCPGAALASGCRCEVSIQPPSLDPMKRNTALERLWLNNAELLGLAVTQKEGPSGSTDLGNLSRIMPVIQPFVAICDQGVALHSTAFADATRTERGRQAMLAGAKALALTAFDYLLNPEAQRAVHAEFQAGEQPAG